MTPPPLSLLLFSGPDTQDVGMALADHGSHNLLLFSFSSSHPHWEIHNHCGCPPPLRMFIVLELKWHHRFFIKKREENESSSLEDHSQPKINATGCQGAA